MRLRAARSLALAGSLAAVAIRSTGRAAGPKFYGDDPIATDPEPEDASRAQPIEISQQFDYVENSFLKAGDRSPRRAVNVNTIDEVPDSSWFTNRAGTGKRPEDVAKGPDSGAGPAPGPWTIVAAKSEGVTPGMTIRDSAGDVYFIKFDPPSNPEMATGAEIVSTKFFHAFGYNVPENYLATLVPSSLAIGDGRDGRDEDGRLQPMEPRDPMRSLGRPRAIRTAPIGSSPARRSRYADRPLPLLRDAPGRSQ